jgi:toxin ParE1/3/4
MIEPIITPRSEADLQEIWNYIAQDSPVAASRFIGELLQVADRLAQSPRIGRARPKFRKGVRSFPHGNYVIFYEVADNRVRILHFVHGSRNLQDLFRRD